MEKEDADRESTDKSKTRSRPGAAGGNEVQS